MKKLKFSFKPLTVAITSALIFSSLSSQAAITEPNNRVKQNYPLGNMEAWLGQADQYALNPVNIRGGRHPDREDPNDGPYDVIYIFPDAASANAWWDGTGTPPDEIPDAAVAFVHWMLDNGSGAFPGIMSKSDIPGFKSRNCIMAAGAEIPVPGPENPAIEKTCSNPQGSSKRFKMNILKPDHPIDLIYNVEPADLTYNNYDTLPSYDGTEESGRIYRVLQKFHNASGMDSATETRDGARIVGFRLELGTGVGGGFTAITNATSAAMGLEPDKTLGFELRPCMPDHFFDVSRDRPGTGQNPCSVIQDTMGQDLPQEIWLEEEYSTFSPKMYSFIDDKRMIQIGLPGGWWNKRPAGIYPPERQQLGRLDSGYAPSDDPVYWANRIDGEQALSGYYGAMAPGYFDIVATQVTDNVPAQAPGINPPSPFGYLMYFGVLSDDDLGNISQGVYIDEDGDPSSEGDLHAWWDGDEFRWGADPDYNGLIDGDAFGVVPTTQLVEWALHPLEEEPDPVTGEYPTGPLYEVGVMDDLAGLNIDYFVYLGRQFTGNQFTVRLTAVSVDNADPYGDGTVSAFPISGTYGDHTPPWIANPAPDLISFVGDDGVIDIKASGYAGDPLLIALADTGIVGALPTVELENLRSGETEQVTLYQDSTLMWKYTYEAPTYASGVAGTNNDGTLNVWPNDWVRVTYVDAFDGTNANVVKTDQVQIPIETLDPPTSDTIIELPGGKSGSFFKDSKGRLDIGLLALLVIGLGYLGLRRKWSRS